MIAKSSKKFGRRTLELWKKERDEVTKSYNVEAFKKFYRKWQSVGLYAPTMALPNDDVIEITMRKMVYNMNSATDEEKAEAEKWLTDRGYTVEAEQRRWGNATSL